MDGWSIGDNGWRCLSGSPDVMSKMEMCVYILRHIGGLQMMKKSGKKMKGSGMTGL